MKSSEKMFVGVLREKYDQFKAAMLGLLDAVSNNDQAKKIDASNTLNRVSTDLASILAQEDRPSWLVRSIEVTRKFSKRNAVPTTITSGSSWDLLTFPPNLEP